MLARRFSARAVSAALFKTLLLRWGSRQHFSAQIVDFLKKRCEYEEGAWVLVSELYSAYEAFAENMEHLTRNMFVCRMQLICGLKVIYKQKKIEGYLQLILFGLRLKGELVNGGVE